MMTKWIKGSILLGAAVVVLGACGLFSVPVDDPLGLEGQPISVRVADGAINVQAVASGQTDPIMFGNVDTGGITPGTFSIDQEIDQTATVMVPSGPLPEVITLSDVTLNIGLSDDDDSYNFALDVSGDATLTLAGPAAGLAPAQLEGTYDVSDVSFSVDLTSAQLAEVNPILTDGPEPNTVIATLSLTATSTPDLPGGSTITLMFGESSAQVGP